jgi:ATP synthase F1 delta subunit
MTVREVARCTQKYARAFLNVHPECTTNEYAQRAVDYAKSLATQKISLAIFDSLIFTPQKQQATVLFFAQQSPSPVFKKLIELLVAQRRLALLPTILIAIAHEIKRHINQVAILVESSEPLQQEEQEMVINFFARKINAAVEPTFAVNNALIAGIKISSANFLWERSVARRLRELKALWSR